tara:strand:- start:104 stop:1441 length:1338 start_codon:yes stop_codon:yes gene_type:complete
MGKTVNGDNIAFNTTNAGSKHSIVTVRHGKLEQLRRIHITQTGNKVITEYSWFREFYFTKKFGVRDVTFKFILYRVDVATDNVDLIETAQRISIPDTEHDQCWIGFINSTPLTRSVYHHATYSNSLGWVHWCPVKIGMGKKQYASVSVITPSWSSLLDINILTDAFTTLSTQLKNISVPISNHSIVFDGKGNDEIMNIPCSVGAHSMVWTTDYNSFAIAVDIGYDKDGKMKLKFNDEFGGTAEDAKLTAGAAMSTFLNKEIHEELGILDGTLTIASNMLNNEINVNIDKRPDVVNEELGITWQSESPHSVHSISISTVDLVQLRNAHEGSPRPFIGGEVSPVVFIVPVSDREKYVSLRKGNDESVTINLQHTMVNKLDDPNIARESWGTKLVFINAGKDNKGYTLWTIQDRECIPFTIKFMGEYLPLNDDSVPLTSRREGTVYRM